MGRLRGRWCNAGSHVPRGAREGSGTIGCFRSALVAQTLRRLTAHDIEAIQLQRHENFVIHCQESAFSSVQIIQYSPIASSHLLLSLTVSIYTIHLSAWLVFVSSALYRTSPRFLPH